MRRDGAGRHDDGPGMTTPVAVTIAGSDSSGGAGIQADLKTFSALGVYGASVIAALTAQNTMGVTAVHAVPADFVAAQMDAVFSDLAAGAVKIGMLGDADVIAAVAAGLDRHRQTSVVLDPLMVASSGRRLLAPGAVDALRKELLPRALVITPNLPEAAVLLGEDEARDEPGMLRQAGRLIALGANAVLMKGGHASGPESTDLLVTATATIRVSGERIATRNTHGTGCTLSAAVAAGLAKGLGLPDALRAAKAYTTAAIAAADRLTIGHGPGPLHHFYGWW
jgi:hydroxymethylpyrimidine/phosphomethylpyrimidine kinase